jgi:hypothetical protein
MGSANFRTINTGATAEDAFDQAVAQAQNEYGCEGYTGTIAEKDGFLLVKLPLNIEAELVVGALDLAQFGDSDYLSDRQEAMKSIAFLAENFVNADNLLACYLNKWAPALCFKLRPPEIVQWGKYNTLPEHQDVFLFAGHASE